MRSTFTKKLLVLIPGFALATACLVLAAGAFAAGGTDLSAPSVGQLPAKADTNATTPDSLSPAVTARDWQETAGSATKKKWK